VKAAAIVTATSCPTSLPPRTSIVPYKARRRAPRLRQRSGRGQHTLTELLQMRGWLLRHTIRVFLHRIRFPGRPMYSDSAAKDLIGKTVIIGVTHQDHAGRVIRRDQFRGRITRANRTEGIVAQAPSGEELKIPPDLRAFFRARPGVYRFRSTGEVVTSPDLQTRWTHTLPMPDARE
jgi:hypothetical protein